MILKIQDIKDIVKHRPTKALWEEAEEQRKVLQMHLIGLGLRDYIQKIDGLERTKLATLRQQYAKSNRDLFARTLRPLDNIWDARGGGVYYNMPESNAKRLKAMLSDVYNSFAVRTWIRNYLRPRLFDDPMGILFMEVSENNPNKTYPTYKASSDVWEAMPRGRDFEWVMFKTKDPSVIRVVDDAFDRMISIKDGKVRELSSREYPVYPNYFGRVPGRILSDIPKSGFEGAFESPVQNEVELAHEFLVDGSIRKIYKFRHGFPKEWRYPLACPTCSGTKYVDGKECGDCGGTGLTTKDDPDKVWVFNLPDKENPELSEKGGFFNPSLEYLESSQTDLDRLEDAIFYTHWGTQKVGKGENTQPETATAKFMDAQPINNRLSLYASTFEDYEKYITNHIGQINFNVSDFSAVSFGRRFLIESPDELLTKYIASVGKVPFTFLYKLGKDYLETKYQNQPLELEAELLKYHIEPLFIVPVAAMSDPKQKQRIELFPLWFIDKEATGGFAGKGYQQLKDDFDAFVEKNYVEPEPEPKPTF